VEVDEALRSIAGTDLSIRHESMTGYDSSIDGPAG
jgi:hypothetical protein